jgi:DNA-binding cell septation regulator SpoVG
LAGKDNDDITQGLPVVNKPLTRRTFFVDDFKEKQAPFPEWIKGDRAIFWVWLSMVNQDLRYAQNGYASLPFQYHEPGDPANPCSSEERIEIIKKWLEKMKSSEGEIKAKIFLTCMRDEWFFVKDNIKTIDWLDQNEQHTLWLWNRLKKNIFFDTPVPERFNPSSPKERLIAINGALDFFTAKDVSKKNELVEPKIAFIQNEKRNYKAMKKKESSCKEIRQINIKINQSTKEKLEVILRENGLKQSGFIENLIIKFWNEKYKSRW